ncbi:cellulose synthase family protein [Ekhidna sp.]|uniref:cellulose synthase family protein n=1 Tax=Ekhidna sp. TaxID=2608089 RepID=UPI003CCBAC7E
MEWLVITLYGLTLMIICLFSLGQFNLTWHYLKSRKLRQDEHQELSEYPFVTVQLPVYNEKYVVERLIDAVCQMQYPKDKLEIQVLDDSSDETIQIIANKVQEHAKTGWNIQHVRRPDRVGYKAGALAYGLEKAIGEYIAIFDADFVPNPEFLIRTLPKFKHEKVGMVQTKWSHLNTDYGWLTKIQAFWLDAHFTVEQKGREHAGSFINFNGTAGVWRKACIEDAGGWQYDTITEDLDLSYRAQLKGWKFVYREEIESPAELPVVIPAVKSQQYRWNKGAAETARKTLGKVLTSNIGWKHKVRAVLHLLNSSVFLLLLIAAVLSIPMLYIKEYNPDLALVFDLGSIFIIGFLAMGFFYWVAAKATHPEYTFRYFIKNFPVFLAFSMGMALHNSIAVIEGYLGIKTPFVRTPKFNVQSKGDSWKGNIYLKNVLTPVTLMEGLLSIYFIYGIFSGFKLEDYGLMLFHAMLAIGFAYVFILSVKPINNA